MLSVNTYNIKGEKIGTTKLLPEIFDVKMNPDLVHQAVVTQLANQRQVIAHTKDRSEVRGGGVKPWRQKGTGRARHGSIRSPLWKGGGVTFGPNKERVYKKKINKKMKRKALFMVLTSKVKDNELILLDKLEIKEPKTKIMAEILKNLFKKDIKNKKQPSILVIISKKDENAIRATRNIPKTKILRADSLNILDLLSFKNLILDKEGIKVIEKTYTHGTIE
jgi:large subunit ribosomal protein L4